VVDPGTALNEALGVKPIEATAPRPELPPIAAVEEAYARWLHDGDPVPTRAVLAAYTANMRLEGDPVGLVLVGGSGTGKTERLMPAQGLPGVVMTSAITGEAALLSATPHKDRAKDATGGLLRNVGDRGVLVVKDFTSVLAMSRDRRNEVMGALREVADGRWDRTYGAEGGQTLTWTGKCGLLAGCTGAIDQAHSVLAAMGTRWVFVRLPAPAAHKISRAALAHMGREAEMREELAKVTTDLLAGPLCEPHEMTPGIEEGLIALACLASQARSR
jgi:hypothetical protein